jgi:hypothetical protein
MIIQPSRRGFITGLTSLLAAPALVRAESLMPVKVIPFDPYMILQGRSAFDHTVDLTVRIYEKSNDPAAFLSADFLNRYTEAANMFAGFPEQVGIAHTREEEKLIRMTEIDRPKTWMDIKKHNVAWDGRDWRDQA